MTEQISVAALDPDEAAAARQRAITRWLFQAIGFQAEGHHAQVCEACQSLLAIDPDHVGALRMLCAALLDAGRRKEAWPHIDRVTALAPMDPAALLLRVRALREEERYSEAIESVTILLETTPQLAGVHAEMGSLMLETRRPLEALPYFDRAIELDASDATSHMNRAVARQQLDLIDESLAGYDQALALEPDHALAIMNRGTLMHYLGRFDEALAAYDRTESLTRPPSKAWRIARYNRCTTLLHRGHYESAWPLLEERWGSKTPFRHIAQPLWLGEQSIDGATILLHWEQGLGDTLMLCRFATDVAARGANVVLSVQASLVDLVRGLPGVDRVVSLPSLAAGLSLPAGSLPEFDFHCPLFSLPLALGGVRADAVPHRKGYLRVDPDRLRHWSRRLGPRHGLRIGMVWSGNASQLNDHRRSMTLARFMRAMPANCELVSLQLEVRDGDRDTLAQHRRLRHFGTEIRDMADTAALCELVDLVVATDTSVPHLAGALGRPVWVLQCFSPDWRWGHQSESSAWYDSARMLRQPAPGAWDPLLDQVHGELSAMARASCL